ncbi:hypothetical protein [Sphaerochaeta sp. PS]|uniref:hypothetical protein n=1 Tax=Sphaerochaeta sp. PS TaxID=3076336 RepID=UPI0028A31925|nr:hypothetical protein [Sphaerochaeta sp. PS]MDT4763307.1 hypothetical protein [Sphaerochaeta sp. PS]
MRRIPLAFLALLLASTALLPAHGKINYALDVSDSYYAAIPHFADEIPFRSSNATSISIGAIGYFEPSFSASLDLTALFVTPSIPFGNYQGRGFNSVGFRLRGSYQFNPVVGIFASIGNEVNYYRTIKEAFISFSIQAGPQFRLLDTGMHTLDLTIPITIHLRKEITAPMIGVGMRYSLAPYTKEEKP